MARKLWHLGNTTVRSPFRLREGLIALGSSSLLGDLHGQVKEIEFRHLLGERGVVELGGDKTYSVGRKWRSALNKMGFVVPQMPRALSGRQFEIGEIDTISENGLRLISADTVPAMQECFLRSLSAYVIPNPTESNYDFPTFSPLKFVLGVLLELERVTGSADISFIEMALFVLPSSPADDIVLIVQGMVEFRAARGRAENKKAFDNRALKRKALELDYKNTTFNDYADATIRYLKATGLVLAKGRGVIINEEKKAFIQDLVTEAGSYADSIEYYKNLCKGSLLPTDELRGALHIYRDICTQAQRLDIPISVEPESLISVADINIERYRLEEKIFQAKEEKYARNQVASSEEILKYIDALILNTRSTGNDDGVIYIPPSERPAYLEWILWRAFLAINHLKNKPYESRRFKIDQSFLPIGTAPGNGPDLIFEFEDFVLVVEVTLTDNSRQEAAEGETVRRHVSDIMVAYPHKTVYGLFIAKNINTNTANTFKAGIWYTKNDDRLEFSIVPITLFEFKKIYIKLLSVREESPGRIKNLIEECVLGRDNFDAPEWKINITNVINTFLQN